MKHLSLIAAVCWMALTPARAASLLGAIGVAGAPGGDKNEACAKAGAVAVQDKLEF